MIELRKTLLDYLKKFHSRIYFQDAPANAAYPYIVYDISSINSDGEGSELAAVDVDGWDMPADGDTTALETLMKNVNGLDKAILRGDGMQAVLYLDTKLIVPDDDKRIKRRRYTYQAKVFIADAESTWKDYDNLTWSNL